MSWETDLVIMVRSLIGDFTVPYKYDDSRIETAIVTGGIIASRQYSFENTYTFTLDPVTITPDPTSEPIAMALFSLKAACMLMQNDFKIAIGKSIRIKDGTSEVDLKGSFGGYKDLLETGPCGSYYKLLNDARNNLAMQGVGGAVFSPHSKGGGAVWGNATREGNFYFRGFWDSFG